MMIFSELIGSQNGKLFFIGSMHVMFALLNVYVYVFTCVCACAFLLRQMFNLLLIYLSLLLVLFLLVLFSFSFFSSSIMFESVFAFQFESILI